MNSSGNSLIQRNKVSYTESIELLSDDVIKIKFVKLWELLGYFESTTSERPPCQKLALWEK